MKCGGYQFGCVCHRCSDRAKAREACRQLPQPEHAHVHRMLEHGWLPRRVLHNQLIELIHLETGTIRQAGKPQHHRRAA